MRRGQTKHIENTALKRVALVGNPNCGKSVLFNALTGLYVDVSNFPGTTVEVTQARLGDTLLIDTPGVYGIASFTDEEKVTRDVCLTADIIVNVVNATQLERDLFLTLQCIDLGLPMVVAVNMLDEAKAHGCGVNLELLSRELGVPVVGTIAVQKRGLAELKCALQRPRVGTIGKYLESEFARLTEPLRTSREVLLYVEDDTEVGQRYGLKPPGSRERIYLARRERVNEIFRRVSKEAAVGSSFSTLVGLLMIRPVTGIPLLLATLYAMYYVIGVFIAGTVVGVTEDTIMVGLYEPAVRAWVTRYLSEGTALHVLLVGEFGLLTMTLTYVLGLLLPLVIGFYLLLSILEDTGYLPRIAALLDRALTCVGLNGRAVIPLILGFGCVTMAAITTRLLGTSRERLIAITLLAITIPCSAQLGVIIGLLAPLGGSFTAMYLLVILTTFVIVGFGLNKVLPGKSSDLLIDLPPLRLPRPSNVAKKTLNKSYLFLVEATPLFALGALLISVLQLTGTLTTLNNILAPLTVGWLELPKEAAAAFIMGIIRRDFGAAGFADMSLTAAQTLVAMVTITLFVPCIAAVLVMFKERSVKEALILWGGTFVIAFLVGGLVAKVVIL